MPGSPAARRPEHVDVEFFALVGSQACHVARSLSASASCIPYLQRTDSLANGGCALTDSTPCLCPGFSLRLRNRSRRQNTTATESILAHPDEAHLLWLGLCGAGRSDRLETEGRADIRSRGCGGERVSMVSSESIACNLLESGNICF